jgi:thiosulfate/3-mercaptopyruvate sulfurtransferase
MSSTQLWSATSSIPGIVETGWLAKNLDKPGIVLIDMSDDLQYQRFHLPGAINLPYHYITQSKNKVSLSIGQKQLIKLLGQISVTQDSHVIVYDDTGGLHASRLLWELEQLGHPNMSLLDGGLVKWIREGRKISFQAPSFKAKIYTPVKTSSHASATLSDVTAAKDKKTLLLDVRTPEEYQGNPKYPRTGHIPGAIHWEWDQALNLDKGFTLQDKGYLKQQLDKAGITDKNQPVIVYCRSGHRAGHTYFTLRQLGFENVKLYDGSIKEYEQNKALPLKLGKQP